MNDSDCLELLRISDAEQTAILRQLNRASSTPTGAELRRAVRYSYTVREGLVLAVEGAKAGFIVRPRNLSTGGISILHGGFVYSGRKCSVALRALDGVSVEVYGRVVRCRCVSGRIHEIGVQFDETIDITRFLAPAGTGADQIIGEDADYAVANVIELARQLLRLATMAAPRADLLRTLAQLVAALRGPQR